jgi:4-hydroxy-2-oxoheptanedioate aldolase
MKDLKSALASGETLVGPLVTCPAPAIVELIGYSGFDWVLIDSEQSATSPSGTDLEAMVRAAYAADITPAVRVSDNHESQINNALNLGAKSVWVPHVESVAEAESAVASFHYAPRGRRGAAPIVRAARYGLEDWDAYRARADRENLLVAIIESVKGLERVEEIAAVPGLDALCFGPFDMAVDFGLATGDFYRGTGGGWIHPKLEEAGMRVLAACQAHSKLPVTAAWSEATAAEWVRRGYRMLLYGLDMALFGKAMAAMKAEADRIKSQP